MIVHIVMFKFKEENKIFNIELVVDKLRALGTSIKELESIEVGVDFNQSQRAFDLSLYSTFKSKEDLKSYAVHPEHLKVVELIKSVTSEAKVVDYEI
ncbi:MAG: Dabb family protein [Sulfurimonas sp.]|nr:Dabb family protein [Sulfurimonas sp.]MDQ7061622.1 Dabb family protein [Sulfurimonas sp.]